MCVRPLEVGVVQPDSHITPKLHSRAHSNAQVLSCGGEGRLLCWPMPGPPQWAAAATADGQQAIALPLSHMSPSKGEWVSFLVSLFCSDLAKEKRNEGHCAATEPHEPLKR